MSSNSLAGVVNDGLVVLIRAVREVHADDIEAGITEGVDSLNRVGLGANGADDGSTAVVVSGVVGRVEGREPGELASANVEMVLGSSSHDAHRARALDARGGKVEAGHFGEDVVVGERGESSDLTESLDKSLSARGLDRLADEKRRNR